MVMDTISLSVNKNVTESTDRIREETVAASAGVDVPVWYDVPELNGSLIASQDNHGGLWTGRISAQEFSDIQQAAREQAPARHASWPIGSRTSSASSA
jgi:hypothetical protein